MSKVAARLKRAVKTQITVGGTHTSYIPAGKASGGPPLGTSLGKLGVNIPAFVKDFNDKTKHLKEGIPVGCEVDVNPDRSYQMTISTPSFTYYLFQAAGITKGKTGGQVAGKTTVKHCYEIAKLKQNDFYLSHKSLQEITELVIKEARTMGITVQKRALDPEAYAAFLVKRKAIVSRQEEKVKQQMEARLLRISS